MKLQKFIFSFILFFLFLFLSFSFTSAQVTLYNSDYVIENFESNIFFDKDTSVLITETITSNFFVNKHGIYRVIPIR